MEITREDIVNKINLLRDEIKIQLLKEEKKKQTTKQDFTVRIINFIISTTEIDTNDRLNSILIKTRMVLESLIYLKWTKQNNNFDRFMFDANNDSKKYMDAVICLYEQAGNFTEEINDFNKLLEEIKLITSKSPKLDHKPKWGTMAKSVGMSKDYEGLYRITSTAIHASPYNISANSKYGNGFDLVLLAHIHKYLEYFKKEIESIQQIENSQYPLIENIVRDIYNKIQNKK